MFKMIIIKEKMKKLIIVILLVMLYGCSENPQSVQEVRQEQVYKIMIELTDTAGYTVYKQIETVDYYNYQGEDLLKLNIEEREIYPNVSKTIKHFKIYLR